MIAVLPISDIDLPAATLFMREHLNPAIPHETWMAAFRRGWLPDKPNNGFMLQDDGRIVGVLGAIYSEQLIGGVLELFCNITSIIVLPEYRGRTMDLFAHCLGQKVFNFTDLTASPAVEKMCRFFKFRTLQDGEYVFPNLPVPDALFGLEAVAAERAEAVLPPEVARIHRDHDGLPWVERLVIGRAGAYCLVIWRRSQVRRFSAANILYVSDERLFRVCYWGICGHLLLRKGLVASRIGRRFLSAPPPLSVNRASTQALLYRGKPIPDGQVASIYSELVALPL
jgi:hypothetical protein